VVIVEGTHDQCVFEEIIKVEKLSNEIEVFPVGGKTLIEENLELVKSDPFFQDEVKAIGIARDADEDADNAFQEVCGALTSTGLPVPACVLTPTDTELKVVVLILPGNGKKGMLEDLCLASVEKDPANECVQKYFECLEAKKVDLPAGSARSKSKVQAFLASRKDTDMHLGIAARKGYWSLDADCFKIIKDFFQLLV